MNLVASMIVRNELDRYLRWTVPALLEVVDELRVLDDHSTDGTADWLREFERVQVKAAVRPMAENEGLARQELLEWTFEAKPTHVLAIDGDELLLDGDLLLDAIEQNTNTDVFTLEMAEVWGCDHAGYQVRVDGGWAPRQVPILYRVPDRVRNPGMWKIQSRAWASGREPRQVRMTAARYRKPTGAVVMHLGWACVEDRRARFDRHMQVDGGRFHASKHLESIMWPDEQVALDPDPRAWPATWPSTVPSLDELVARVNRTAPTWQQIPGPDGAITLFSPDGFPLVFVDGAQADGPAIADDILEFLRARRRT